MNRLACLLCAAAVVCCAAWAPAQSGTRSGSRGPDFSRTGEEEAAPRATAPADVDPAARADQLLQGMSLRARIGQLMLVTVAGQRQPRTEDFAYLEKYPPGAVLIRQLLQPAFATHFIGKLRGLEAKTGVPLLVGGDLYTLSQRDRGAPSVFPQVPTPLAVGAAHSDAATRAVAGSIAAQMKAMGFDFHLGPSLALAPVIDAAPGTLYTFGSDPAFGRDAARVFTEELARAGLLYAPVGFPGGQFNRTGDDPPVLLTPNTLLAQRDLLPFAGAIDAGVEMVHVGATLVPLLAPEVRTACFSPEVIGGQLRADLGFRGVVLAGPFDGRDIAERHDPVAAAIESLEAGADMLWWHETGGIVAKAVHAIEGAVEAGRLNESRINASAARILAMKLRHRQGGNAPEDEVSLGRLGRHRDVSDVAADVERRSITLVQNHGNVLPLDEDISMPIAITGSVGTAELQAALEEHIKPISELRIATARHLGRIERFEIERLQRNLSGVRTLVMMLWARTEVEGQIELLRAMRDAGIQTVVVLVGYPRDLPRLSGADAIVLAYCDPANGAATMTALGDVLAGETPLRIVAPTADAQVRAGEPRTYRAIDLLRAPAGRLPVDINTRFPLGLAVPYTRTEQFVRRVDWDFGDGERARDEELQHHFEAPGRYPVTLTVTDQARNETSEVFHVEVLP